MYRFSAIVSCFGERLEEVKAHSSFTGAVYPSTEGTLPLPIRIPPCSLRGSSHDKTTGQRTQDEMTAPWGDTMQLSVYTLLSSADDCDSRRRKPMHDDSSKRSTRWPLRGGSAWLPRSFLEVIFSGPFLSCDFPDVTSLLTVSASHGNHLSFCSRPTVKLRIVWPQRCQTLDVG